ncbi:MAG: DUF4191 family protein [Kiritimatiellae bacterium]|nr:DUF4191 family protein [Kiritimatiellia bacterium]
MTDTRATMRGIPGDAARKRGLRRIFVPLLVFGILFGFAFGVLLGNMDVLPWWVGLILLVAAFIAFFIFKKNHTSLVYGYFKGARGEEMVAGELARLPASWTIFNGLILPNGTDADHVAVGPQGIFIIETKHWRGNVSIEEGNLLANGRPLMKSPLIQVRTLTSELASFLEMSTSDVRGVLCFAGAQFHAASQQIDEVTICSYLNLSHVLTDAPTVLDAAEVATYVARLSSLTITQGL